MPKKVQRERFFSSRMQHKKGNKTAFFYTHSKGDKNALTWNATENLLKVT